MYKYLILDPNMSDAGGETVSSKIFFIYVRL